MKEAGFITLAVVGLAAVLFLAFPPEQPATEIDMDAIDASIEQTRNQVDRVLRLADELNN